MLSISHVAWVGSVMEKDKTILEQLHENNGKEKTDSKGLSGGTGQLLWAPVPSIAEMQWDLYLETKFSNSTVCEKQNILWKDSIKISPEFVLSILKLS